jgi:phosphonate transport system permease protein
MSDVVAREWRRFTPRERAIRYAVYLATAIVFSAALRSIEIVPEFLRDTPAQVGDLLVRMWPVDWGFLVSTVMAAMLETIHIATLGTLATLVIAFPLGVLAARTIVVYAAVRFVAKLCLVASRSVNSLVWALFFVAVFGPGALAGTVAITFRSIGFVGKLLGEALEEVAPGPV